MAAEVEASTSKAAGGRQASSRVQRAKAKKMAAAASLPRNRDLPSKEEVDRDQAEQESLTWADR